MKKLLSGIIAIMVVSCSSPEKNVRNLIENKLKTSMNDWSSYEFVEMTKLDSTFTTFVGSPTEIKQYKLIRQLKDSISNLQLKADLSATYSIAERKEFIKQALELVPLLESSEKEYLNEKESFKKEHEGWYTDFTYRGNNKLGAKIIGKSRFIFNKEMSEITESFSVK